MPSSSHSSSDEDEDEGRVEEQQQQQPLREDSLVTSQRTSKPASQPEVVL